MKKERKEEWHNQRGVPSSSVHTRSALHFHLDLGGRRNLRAGHAQIVVAIIRVVVIVAMFLLFGFPPQEVTAHKPLEANEGKNNNFECACDTGP
jgi:hypothetical protein